MGVTRTFVITRCYNVRRYERWEVTTVEDLEAMQQVKSIGEFDDFVCTTGEELSSDYDTVDDDQLDLLIEEVIEPEVDTSLPVPYPPTTAEQAEAWVRWAETEIGVGWHPDTPGKDLATYDWIGLEARCECGETFNPHDLSDTIHVVNDKGDVCGLRGMVVGSWGNSKPLFPDPDVCARYDAGLDAAHELLPDIYATSMAIFKELHPELLTDEGKDTP